MSIAGYSGACRWYQLFRSLQQERPATNKQTNKWNCIEIQKSILKTVSHLNLERNERAAPNCVWMSAVFLVWFKLDFQNAISRRHVPNACEHATPLGTKTHRAEWLCQSGSKIGGTKETPWAKTTNQDRKEKKSNHSQVSCCRKQNTSDARETTQWVRYSLCMRTWVPVPRTYLKLYMLENICNPQF